MPIPHRGFSIAFSTTLLLLSCRLQPPRSAPVLDSRADGGVDASKPEEGTDTIVLPHVDAPVDVANLAECGTRFTPVCGELAPVVCGNGLLTAPEACDDGNTVSGDGCTAGCTAVEPGWRCRVPGRPCAPICGDRLLEGRETCEDGNTVGGDGCSSFCLTEPGWDCSSGVCVQVPSIDGGLDLGDDFPRCGDGTMSGAEECDLGPLNSDTEYGGCATTCYFGPFCGDGVVNGAEECDLGDNNGQSYGKGGCTLGCTKTHYCGDGNVDPDYGEECDLGDRNGVKLDSNFQPSVSAEARVYCDLDCRIPPCGCVY